jgi:hypothetical protein
MTLNAYPSCKSSLITGSKSTLITIKVFIEVEKTKEITKMLRTDIYQVTQYLIILEQNPHIDHFCKTVSLKILEYFKLQELTVNWTSASSAFL